MLTVLVKKSDNTEVIYECVSVEKEEHALLLRGDNLGSSECRGLEILGPGGQTMAWDWDRKISNPGLSETSASVFIMNDNGKTVGRYSLPDSLPLIKTSRVKILPLAANDSNHVVYRYGTDSGEAYYRTNVEINLFDLAHNTSSIGLNRVDRTDLVSSDASIKSVVIVVTDDQNNTIGTFTISIDPILFSRTNNNRHQLIATRDFTFIATEKTISYYCENYGVEEIQLLPLEFKIHLSGNLHTATGAMILTGASTISCGGVHTDGLKSRILACSVEAYFDKE